MSTIQNVSDTALWVAVYRAMDDAQRLHREMRMMWMRRFMGRFMSAKRRAAMERMSGTILLERIDR
jgi:hypothetical protein